MTTSELLQIAKPIFFETDLVQRILSGNKSATRRICKDGNVFTVPDMGFYDGQKRTYAVHNYADKDHTEKLSLVERTCPFCIGDILYVRETWKVHALNPSFCMMIRYRADNFCDMQVKFSPSRYDMFQKYYKKDGWQSPYFMPKEAARILLKVIDVRVEHLHDITNEQIIKEGVSRETIDHYMGQVPENTEEWERWAHLLAFSQLWDSTIKKKDLVLYGWEANPWVWVVEFERIEVDLNNY